ncbi:protein-L-isoaspartate(D-aspartate) O-methyltransferase [Halothermothrix orenii]|uniref:Protein-L-isoaspartate O-methyltransferase n=1 Tax=Halothermothrix orenii (strain H 168 / OCM 544 / DSM 9562) TaxID=373903 RepID=B8CY26_HALOH|nr:protein-L-isoaspartate(D-aspartate) O-methyltransferase [Halothermothrix orenii]ACL70195.1 protein-L-isoaspartate O-methyltransferase [Halothermothrix orenii H 168]
MLWSQNQAYTPEEMIKKHLKPRGIKNKLVLKAMRQVPRHVFVPEKFKAIAYYDRALPIDKGQTISQPYIVALMIQTLNPKKSHRILEIGTGSGYAAAVLSHIARQVYTVERIEQLANRARELFNKLDYSNIEVKVDDGSLGWSEKAPFDGIIVSAGAPAIPETLTEQLKEGGRLVIPVGKRGGLQYLTVVTRDKNGEINQQELEPVRFVPLIGQEGFKENNQE